MAGWLQVRTSRYPAYEHVIALVIGFRIGAIFMLMRIWTTVLDSSMRAGLIAMDKNEKLPDCLT